MKVQNTMVSIAGCSLQGEMQQGSDVLAHNVQRDTPVSQGQGPLETLMCPASIDKYANLFCGVANVTDSLASSV